jgi:molybdate transport system regulatory protein
MSAATSRARRAAQPSPCRLRRVPAHPPQAKVRFHLWLENTAGEALFGPGRLLILRAIDNHGSLLAAAGALGMSYRALWAKVRDAERRLGLPLIEAHAGRGPASGATLTPQARELMERFTRLHAEVATAIEARYVRLFAPSPRGTPRTARTSRTPRPRRAR